MGAKHKLARCRSIISIFFISGLLLMSCSGAVSEEDRQAVYNLIEWNLYYARIEDMNGYMWTLHPDSPVYSDTQSQMAIAFREFDLAYEIEEWENLSISSEAARVRVVQATRNLADTQSFSDNRIEGIHTLHKNGEDEWKIYSSEFNLDSIEYLTDLTP